MDALVPLVFLVPLASALLTLAASQGLHRDSVRISIAGAVATFLCASGLLGLALAGHTAGEIRFGTTWGVLLFDPLSSLMAFVVSGISLIVHVYSSRSPVPRPCNAGNTRARSG